MTTLEALSQLFSDKHLLTDADSLLHYGRDWSRVHQPDPLAIVFPESTEQVQALVKLANEHQFALVPSGGRTGLSGGAIASNQEVVVSFDRMNKVLEFNAIDRSVRCQPGVITAQLQQLAEDNDLFYPVDFASSGSSQIGGNIATNAGGIKVIGYGLTRNWVSGLTVVTGEGRILELNHGLFKNATGYDLRHLFIGSEGTLGFITEATMQLTKTPQNLTVMVLGVPDVSSLMKVFETFRNAINPTAFESFIQRTVDIVHQEKGLPKPFETDAPFYILLEFENDSEARENKVLETFEYCAEQGWVLDGVMSQSEQQARDLWRLREDISESINAFTPYKNDLSVRMSEIPAFLEKLEALVSARYPDFEVVWYGHIGDGNLHLNILKPADMPAEEFFKACATVNHEVFSLVKAMRGSISAEHGVGLIKRDYLNYSREEDEVAYMRAMKAVFDPNNVMNPGKMLTA